MKDLRTLRAELKQLPAEIGSHRQTIAKNVEMARSKGRQSAKSVEQDFPHFVEIAVPSNGLGNTLIAMYDFHAKHGIEAKRGHGRRDDGASYIRWCFADPALADAFTKEFDT